MDELLGIWASWSPEAREKVLNVHNSELVNRIDTNMRLLWTNEIKGAGQSPVDPFDYSKYPLTSTMQFDGVVMQDQKVYKVVKWPKEIVIDPATVPAAVRSASGRRQPNLKRVNPTRWAQALLHPPPKSWSEFERQLAQLIEQLVLHAHSQQGAASGRTGSGSNTVGKSGSTGVSKAMRPAEIEEEDELLGSNLPHDGEGVNSAGEDAETATNVEALTGRAAKRARQRERRRMFKAANKQNAADANEALSGAIEALQQPTPAPVQPREHPPLQLGIRGAPPPHGSARGANTPRGIGGPGLARPQGAGGGRRTDSPVWQPPGIWEPARIDLLEAADAFSLDADDLADAEAPQLQDVSGDEEELLAQTGREAAKGATSRAATSVTVIGGAESSEAAAKAEVPELIDATEPAKVVTEAGSLDEVALKEPVKVLEDTSDLETNPWSGRPMNMPANLIFGVGRGRPLGEAEPEARWGDSFGSMGMGRGRALTPPPGLVTRKSHRAPGGLAQTWMPGPSIPEEDGDDPEKQTITEDFSRQDIDGWLHNMQFTDHLASALSQTRSNSSWSQASFVGTPSMAWSKTPSPPSTPINRSMAMPPGRPGVQAGAFGNFALPGAWQGSMAGGIPTCGVSPVLGPGGQPTAGPIPLYVTVPIAMAHNCPHCGRAFALPPDDIVERVADGSDGDGDHEAYHEEPA